jgi:hypothetical protein
MPVDGERRNIKPKSSYWVAARPGQKVVASDSVREFYSSSAYRGPQGRVKLAPSFWPVWRPYSLSALTPQGSASPNADPQFTPVRGRLRGILPVAVARNEAAWSSPVGQWGSLLSMSAVGVTSASAGISAKVSIPAKPIPIPFAGVGFGDRTGAGMSELGFR